jgi:hypothetical protein
MKKKTIPMLGIMLAMFSLMIFSVQAQSQPPGCTSTGVGLSLTAYREDGVTPIAAETVVAGELIKYQATLSSFPTNCYFEGGTLTIETPDGVVHDVTPPGGIPLVTYATPFVSDLVDYTVSLDDAEKGDDYYIRAAAVYTNGTSLLGAGVSPISAETPSQLEVELEYLEVKKNAQPLIERTIEWDITKTVDPDEHNLTGDEIGESWYNVTVTKIVGEDVYSVTGLISILNPSNTSEAVITGVEDTLDNISVDVDCNVEFPYTLNPGFSLVCTYNATLPDDSTLTNFVEVTTTGNILGGNATAEVDFAEANVTILGYEEVTVDDTNGESWVFNETGSEIYSMEFTCFDVEFTNGFAEYTHENTATIVETNQSDSALVTVRCQQVFDTCTLTQGYWKTHSEYGPAPYDETWGMLPDGADTEFFLSGMTYYEVLNTPPAGGNAYYQLAHQYIAAELNKLAGADFTDAQDAFDDATALFETYTPAEIGALRGNNALRQEFISLAGTLADYNEGIIGPGHCDDEEEVISV